MLMIFHSSFIVNQEVTYGNWISLIPSHQTGWVYIILQVHTWLSSLHTFGHRAMLKLSAPESWCILQSTLSPSPLAAVSQGKCWPICTQQAETKSCHLWILLFVCSFLTGWKQKSWGLKPGWLLFLSLSSEWYQKMLINIGIGVLYR